MHIQKKLRSGNIIRVLNRKKNTLMFPGIYKVINIMNGMMCYQMGQSFGFLELDSLGDYEKLEIKGSKVNWNKQEKEYIRQLEEFKNTSLDQEVEVIKTSGTDGVFKQEVEMIGLKS